MKGVPINYKENWAYHGRWSEKKVAPGKWKIQFRATKRRKAGMGALQRGTLIKWRINAFQYAKKTGKGEYQTNKIGTKTLVNIKAKTKRRR